MNKLLLTIVAVILLGAGCATKETQQNVVVETPKKVEVDYFNKKQECAKYLDQYVKKWDEGSKEYLYLRPTICFSKSRNTCILFEEILYHDGTHEMMATDVLTQESIYDNFYDPKDKDKSQVKESVTTKLEEQKNCVE